MAKLNIKFEFAYFWIFKEKWIFEKFLAYLDIFRIIFIFINVKLSDKIIIGWS